MLLCDQVGKGLSKDAEEQKLAFQHWIEAGHSSSSGQKQKFTSFRICFRIGTEAEIFRKNSRNPATFVVVDGWTVTIASVGDSRCILDAQDCGISILTVDH
ncbi:unnamed protein product [Fraxinus pennsylvanica]|uniref:Uncharacterized protein n=1 Tax=Fraxinus pennsylvanica TaxID=56036 RepID=A0AAD2AD03_9LAMI|nr:unnamed protein product [Fraxinus pennsylvanica]